MLSDAVTQLRGVQGLVTFESRDQGSALAAAEATARELIPQEHWGADIFTAVPEGARWTADELNEQLLHQQAYEPQGDVRVLIIASAHMMDARLHDHLLKIVEEPPAPVLFVFVVEDSGTLPITLQSRIYRSFPVPPRTLEDLAREVSAASEATPSQGVLHLCQMGPMLASGLTGENSKAALPRAEDYLRSLQGRGFTAAFRATHHLKELAKAVSGGSAEAPKTKAAQREALRVGLQLLREEQMRILETGSVDEAILAEYRLGRIDRAAGLADTHLPPDQVFGYAMTGGGHEI